MESLNGKFDRHKMQVNIFKYRFRMTNLTMRRLTNVSYQVLHVRFTLCNYVKTFHLKKKCETIFTDRLQ